MAFNRTEADAILKNDYIGPIREQVNLSSALLANVSRNTEDVEGLEAVIPLHVGRAEAVGARADGGTLPAARSQKYAQMKVPMTYQYARIKVTGPTIRSTKSDKGSFLRAVEAETKGAVKELKEDFSRQLATNDRDGSGALATCGTTSNSTTVQLATAEDAVTYRRLRKNMYVDIVNSTNDTVLASNRKVTAVDTTNDTITIDGAAVTTTSDHRVCRTGSWKNEMVGLPGIVDDTGTLQSVNPSTHDAWKAYVKDAAGANLSEDLLQQVFDEVDVQSGEEPNFILGEHTQRRKFYALLSSMKRSVDTQTLKGGFKALMFNDDKPFVVDRFIGDDVVYVINMEHTALYEQTDWDWADDDGAILSRVSGEDAFEAYLYKFAEFATDQRNAHGRIKGLAA